MEQDDDWLRPRSPADPLWGSVEGLSLISLIFLALLGPATARLNWQVSDVRSTRVRITVLVVDILGNTIRRIDGGTRTVTPGVTLNGFTGWDGRDANGDRPTGVFHHRVVVTDDAGNRSQSGEFRPIQVVLL